MAKPVHVHQRGDEVRDIVNIAALAVVDAQEQPDWSVVSSQGTEAIPD